MITINEVNDRNKLGEGRSSGMAFAFLKKLNDETFETVQPLSPCKDFLNEPVYTELTGAGSSAHGLSYPAKLNIFTDCLYMAIKMMPDLGGKYKYGIDIEKDIKYLNDNYKNIETLLNYFEDALNMSNRTIITKANDEMFLIQGPIEWVASTYAVSLYTLLTRCALVYDGTTEPMEFLEKYSYNVLDTHLILPCIKKIKAILEIGQIPLNTFPEKNEYFCPHNLGIMMCPMPVVKVLAAEAI